MRTGFNLSELPHVDIMEELHKTLGHRVSLESVATATLNEGKSGNGLMAIEYYRNGDFENLAKYCLDDVRITKDVYEFGIQNAHVFFTKRYGNGTARVNVDWKSPDAIAPDPSQYDLF